MSDVLLDNDIVAKAIAYGLTGELMSVLGPKCCVLGTLRFAINEKRLKTASDGGPSAYARLKTFLQSVEILEPTPRETQFAAELEKQAIELKLSFDIGESQLVAIALLRGAKFLCTGDKRAIAALEPLRSRIASGIDGRIITFEALMLAMVRTSGHAGVRTKVCDAKGTDKAVEICFHCHEPEGKPSETETCLRSYLEGVKRNTPGVCGDL